MEPKSNGIIIAGNILTDTVKSIDSYPAIGMLSNITAVSQAVGGCVPNVGIDLAKIDPSLPLSAVGCIGRDAGGEYVLSQLRQHGLNTDGIVPIEDAPTGFSDVMSLPSGERTFFHARGANALFAPHHVDMTALKGDILHIGYILLLDRFDAPDADYGTVMARFLRDIQAKGIKTSVDVVSSAGADYKAAVIPALPYCDYVIMNEIECCATAGVEPCDSEGHPLVTNIRAAMETLAAYGVREKVIVHCKEAGFCLDVATRRFTVVPSLRLDAEQIRGSVGAGDAFCAGCLYGLYHGYTDEALLRFASAAAACSLFADNSVDGMRKAADIHALENEYDRLSL